MLLYNVSVAGVRVVEFGTISGRVGHYLTILIPLHHLRYMLFLITWITTSAHITVLYVHRESKKETIHIFNEYSLILKIISLLHSLEICNKNVI